MCTTFTPCECMFAVATVPVNFWAVLVAQRIRSAQAQPAGNISSCKQAAELSIASEPPGLYAGSTRGAGWGASAGRGHPPRSGGGSHPLLPELWQPAHHLRSLPLCRSAAPPQQQASTALVPTCPCRHADTLHCRPHFRFIYFASSRSMSHDSSPCCAATSRPPWQFKRIAEQDWPMF